MPIPWSGEEPPFGFSPRRRELAAVAPAAGSWRRLTVAAQAGVEGSMLELYRRALRLRRSQPALGDGTLEWLDAPAGALAFAREPGFACIVNVSADPVQPPDGAEMLLASGPLAGDGRVPADTAIWLRVRD